MSSTLDNVGEDIMFVHSSGQMMLPRYPMNGLNNLDKTGRMYSLAPTDDLIRFWRSKIKGQGHSRPMHVVAKAFTSMLGRPQHRRECLSHHMPDVQVRLVVFAKHFVL